MERFCEKNSPLPQETRKNDVPQPLNIHHFETKDFPLYGEYSLRYHWTREGHKQVQLRNIQRKTSFLMTCKTVLHIYSFLNLYLRYEPHSSHTKIFKETMKFIKFKKENSSNAIKLDKIKTKKKDFRRKDGREKNIKVYVHLKWEKFGNDLGYDNILFSKYFKTDRDKMFTKHFFMGDRNVIKRFMQSQVAVYYFMRDIKHVQSIIDYSIKTLADRYIKFRIEEGKQKPFKSICLTERKLEKKYLLEDFLLSNQNEMDKFSAFLREKLPEKVFFSDIINLLKFRVRQRRMLKEEVFDQIEKIKVDWIL
nr:MAG: hypothetical protein [Porcellio scaber clopovirus]